MGYGAYDVGWGRFLPRKDDMISFEKEVRGICFLY